jgi:predicted Zn-dependent protease
MSMRFIFFLILASSLIACNSANIRNYENTESTKELNDDESRIWYAAEKLDEGMQNKGLVYNDKELNSYLQAVMDKMYPEFKGSIRVFAANSADLNAFALPNGSIYINIGLLARMQNEAQLATILGHEAAHFIRQHGLKKRGSADSAVVASVAITAFTGLPLVGDLVTSGFMAGYSRDIERDADHEGFQRMASRGYEPSQAAEVFKLMLEEVEALEINRPFMYSSHPQLKERIGTLTGLAESAPTSSGVIGAEVFRQKTQNLKEAVLQRYLDVQDYKRLALILEDKSRRSLYPVHAKYYLAESYRLRNEEGDKAKAMEAYKSSIQEAPSFAPNYKALGVMYMKDNDSSLAVKYLERYLELTDTDSTAYVESYLQRLRGEIND